MTIEQRPELNRFADPSFNWDWRWRLIKTSLPLWVFLYVCMGEILVIDGWLGDKLTLDFLATMIAGVTLIFLFVLGMIELQMFYYCRCKRVLRIEDKQISFRFC